MLKFTAICLGLAMSAATARGEVHQGVQPGRKAMVARVARDRYAVVGEGELRTRGCTFSAPMLEARVEAGRRPWVWFYGRDGELEGGCELETGAVWVARSTRQPRVRIPRTIAVTR